jgi:hypothetical protein
LQEVIRLMHLSTQATNERMKKAKDERSTARKWPESPAELAANLNADGCITRP